MKYPASKRVNISLPPELLEKLDSLAKRNYLSRSELIRYCLMAQLSSQLSNSPPAALDKDNSVNPAAGHPTK